jgi:hypothetical protein
MSADEGGDYNFREYLAPQVYSISKFVLESIFAIQLKI